MENLLSDAEMEAVIDGDHGNVFAVLGIHRDKGSKNVFIRAFQPHAKSIEVIGRDGVSRGMMNRLDERGFFQINLGAGDNFSYRFKIENDRGEFYEAEDTYRFRPTLGDIDVYLLGEGSHLEMYKKLGAHVCEQDGVKGVSFAVWAPNAKRVSVVGNFNNWDGRTCVMRKYPTCGVWDIFVPGLGEGEVYKYEIKTQQDYILTKSDPVGFYAEKRPHNASIVYDLNHYRWNDEEWMSHPDRHNRLTGPMSIYEVHAGSWRRKGENGGEYLTYSEMADTLVPYVTNMGFTHVEFLPLAEHPLDASWGYQVVGMFAPTSRFGTPDDLRYLIDKFHQSGIAVIMDWVPAHFPKDGHGLCEFDGTHLYEHADPRKGEHKDWGTKIYNYGRTEVFNYLCTNALYWLKEYHIDGLRVDAVASMLYLDYSRNPGEWIPNIYGGNENLEAVEFLKHTNSMIQKRGRGAVTIAEESTAWPKVTGDLNDGGLGFTMKWNMGWMNDFLDYMQYDPYFRAYHHNDLTFSMVYAYSEKFMLVLSHDEVVHGKASMLSKMPGEEADKFANLRAGYGYMMTHPGKKLLFMGQDIAEYDEWNEERGVEWELLKYDHHEQMRRFVKRLNELYRKNPALYAEDDSWDGFEWIDCIDANECTLSYLRKSDKEEETLLVCLNFANVDRPEYRVGVPFEGKYTEVLNSDDIAFGGKGRINSYVLEAEEIASDGRENSILMHQAPLSVSIFAYTPYTDEEKEERRKIAEAAQKAAEEAVRKAAEEAAKKEAIAKKAAEEAAKKEEAARKAAEEAAEKEAVARQAAEEVVRKTAAAKKAVEEAAKKAAAMKKKTLKEELTEKAEQADSAILEGKEKEKPARRTTRKKTATAKAVAPKEPTAKKPASVAKKSTSSAKVTKGTKA